MTKNRSAKVGIFGGSFDPPHVAHLHLVVTAKSEFQLNKIYIVPSKFPPGKEPVASYEKRIEWTAEVFGEDSDLIVSDIERKSQMTVFGKDIFNQVSLLEPDAQLHWILGEDQLNRLSFWKDIDSYGSQMIWIVTPRRMGHHPAGLLSKRLLQSSCSYYWTKMAPMIDVASHTIRDSLIERGAQSPHVQWIPEVIRKDVLETYASRNQSIGR